MPWEASTTSTTPSQAARLRLTSYPKSTWPGVSMRWMTWSPHRTRTFWALMVMPRSRSMSMESRNCSLISLGSTAPVSSSIRSDSVLLPWSMWAMIDTLRIWEGWGMSPSILPCPGGTSGNPQAAGRPSHSRPELGDGPPFIAAGSSGSLTPTTAVWNDPQGGGWRHSPRSTTVPPEPAGCRWAGGAPGPGRGRVIGPGLSTIARRRSRRRRVVRPGPLVPSGDPWPTSRAR